MFWTVRTNLDEYELRSPCYGGDDARRAGRDALEEIIRHKDDPGVRTTLVQVYAFMQGRAAASAPHFAAQHERAFLERMRAAVATGPLLVRHVAPKVKPTGPTHDEAVARAFAASRSALRDALRRARALQSELRRIATLDGPGKISAIQMMVRAFARDIAVITDKLWAGADPLSAQFRDALVRACDLMDQNLAAKSGIIDEGALGRCKPDNFNPPGVPFAATLASAPDPRVSVCTPFFTQPEDMQRDVVTHEFFHLLGLADVGSVTSTADALDDANTMAQLVAYLVDRTRTHDSSGLSRPGVTYPSP